MINQVYAVTLRVVDNGRHPFGKIQDGQMILNQAGQITAACWRELAQQFDDLHLDAFVVMPNHLHGIVILGEQTVGIGTGFMGQGFGPAVLTDVEMTEALEEEIAKRPEVDGIIQTFMGMVTDRLQKELDINNDLWQKPYQLRPIRSEKALNALRHAIYKNPAHWRQDRFYSEPTTQSEEIH